MSCDSIMAHKCHVHRNRDSVTYYKTDGVYLCSACKEAIRMIQVELNGKPAKAKLMRTFVYMGIQL